MDDSKRSATAGVVDDVTNDTLKLKSKVKYSAWRFAVLFSEVMFVRQPPGGLVNHYPVGSAFASSGSFILLHHANYHTKS